ncbi:gephyrin-like molybdotransferase Glp [Qingshengfaniella alkalisoli]|uniref:Molybdopterin molybdenumtransferase n=1 Tax=Qingshengfaniella alkalisoli TaxID=2599296 RepID=A0A5B8IXD6_9RHOB|nr:gephyrin-like molybdotransferase Glp [Qingshengfaniella alkalisoli]QDY69248.1 molybdopterin molybdotransferase MoeA [Qingshengfaniella alkalisoli]
MISVPEALGRIFALLTPVGTENIPLRQANGRVLAVDAIAPRDQPPFPASAMDGYAIRHDDAELGKELTVIGTSAAGAAFAGPIGNGKAVRIFTGAPVPVGADRIVIQEHTTRDADRIKISDLSEQDFIRARASDFAEGFRLGAPRRLGATELTLLASMNQPEIEVYRRPKVAIISTGDELVMPGDDVRADQIFASNAFGLAALVENMGGIAQILPIARDNLSALRGAFDLAANSDLIVTSGGASVGDHDLLGNAAEELGLTRYFYKVAMRPGKPLMAGMFNGIPLIGLPGNPVSSIVCGTIFVCPALRYLQGLPAAPIQRITATLGRDLPHNGPREHYMRAMFESGSVTVYDHQDSSLQTILSGANCLLIRPPNAAPAQAGQEVEIIQI